MRNSEKRPMKDDRSRDYDRSPTRCAESRQELQGSIRRIVRQVIRSGRSSSRLARQILAMARGMTRSVPDSFRDDDREWLIGQITRRICQVLLAESPSALIDGRRDTIRYEHTLQVDSRLA